MPLHPIAYVATRARMIRDYAGELWRHGAPVETGDPRYGTVFLLDGIGGFRLTPTLARIAFRQANLDCATYLFDWHRGPRGEMLADLTCLRANRRQALRLARLIRRRRHEYPTAPIHILSYSGGTGIATFAVEALKRCRIELLILAAPAISPGYDLGPALDQVDRCVVLVSRRDYGFLGLGTTLFGTVDRRFGAAAGLVGFQRPGLAGDDRLVHIRWQPEMRSDGHLGHHVGAASVGFIRNWIVPLIREHGGPPDP